MVIDKLKQLQATKRKVARLAKSIAAQMKKEFSRLPSKYGFENVQSFSEAVLAAGQVAKKRRGRPPKNPAAVAAAAPVATSSVALTAAGKPRQRAVITSATRAELKKMVKAGKTGEEIAKTLGISLPSVYNIKKALGLIRVR